MSRADLWMFAATMSIEYGIELDTHNNASQKILPEIGYFCGRSDCYSSPFTNNDFVFFEAQSPCLDAYMDWLTPRYGFTGDIKFHQNFSEFYSFYIKFWMKF